MQLFVGVIDRNATNFTLERPDFAIRIVRHGPSHAEISAHFCIESIGPRRESREVADGTLVVCVLRAGIGEARIPEAMRLARSTEVNPCSCLKSILLDVSKPALNCERGQDQHQ